MISSEEKFGWQVEFHQRGMHTPLKEIEDLPDYFSIAFVRNPFEVIVSAWDPEQYKDFDQFIEQRILTGLEICGRHSQLEHLSSEDGTLLVNFVGRFGRWAYLWSDDCFLSGKLTAEKIHKNLN